MTSRTAMVCRALAAWLAVTVALPITAAAEYGLPAGASAVMSAGQPTLVRIAPGWDAAVAYEIADGVPVTVWDAQTAPDGSPWYAIDGGFIPAESVSSVETLEPGSQQAYDAATAAWTEPLEEVGDPASAAAPVAADAGADGAVTSEWIDPATSSGYVDPATGAWVEPTSLAQEALPEASNEPDAQPYIVDPNTSTSSWVDPVAVAQGPAPDTSAELGVQAGFVDPDTGAWVEPSGLLPEAATEAWTEPIPDAAPSEITVQQAPGDAWIGPMVEEEWAAAVPDETAAVGAAVWEPDDTYVELEQRGKKRDKKNKGKYKKGERGGNGGDHAVSTSNGQQIADFALQYQGYPYVYAGEGPNAFDCSGFTMFVIRETLGVNITHDMFTQYDMGQEIGRGDLQPGDLVFFRNTFRRGMSHNGIYIGSGQFVHAENESTGVVVSDLESDYYGSRWYGAVRIGA